MLTKALDLAAQNIPVFPCAANKCPTTPNGFKDASTEPDKVQELWRNHPGDLIGVPTGAVSGFDVLDLDVKHRQACDWWRESRQRIPRTRIHRTRSGGLHLLFAHNDVVRCSAGKICLGVDTRADGGYVIWWPAAGLPVLSEAPPAPWPDWLLEEFRPKPRPSTPSSPTIVSRGEGWLRGLVRTVIGAAEGQRNSILFWAARRGGEAVRDGKAGADFVADVLAEAALRIGLPQPEARRTIQSGMRRS
jgi:Bifunctional DNA primase/polymerase, N-terminal